MHHRSQRTRLLPGPLTLLALAVALAPVVMHAHDPGLSALDINANGTTIAAVLSISSADVIQLSATTGKDPQESVREVVRDVVRISVDDDLLRLDSERIELGADGARIHLSFSAPTSGRVTRLRVASNLPARLSRGHRELVVITTGGRVVAERVLDAVNNGVAVDLLVAQPSAIEKSWAFLTLGVRHILAGYDHLAFLAGLILAAASLRALALALTAFTVAHSLSLALVVVAGVHAPPSIVEPLIAASIAWIGIENLLRNRDRDLARWWLVFGFGLIHGFGFAGGLMELGLGSTASEIAIALLSFNGGVEIGQLGAALAILPVVRVMQSRPVWRATLVPLCSSLIVIAGGYWLIERLW